MKKRFSFVLVLVLAFSSVSPILKTSDKLVFLSEVYAQSNEITVKIDGQSVDFAKYGSYPKIVNGTTYVPLRSVFESLGATELTDSEENNVGNYPVSMNEIYSFKKNVNGYDVTFTVDIKEKMQPFNSYYMTYYRKDGQKALMDLQGHNLILENGRTYLPLKAVSQAFGYTVGWDDNTKTVTINTSNPTCDGMTVVDTKIANASKTSTNNNNTSNNSTSNNNTSSNTNTSTSTDTFVPLTQLEQNQLMLEKVNALREENGLNPLVLDDKLIELAFAKAEDWNEGGYSDNAKGKNGYSSYHISPRYGNPIEMYETMFGEREDIWENFAMKTSSQNYVTEAFHNWYTSEGHLKAMLKPNLTKMGFGYALIDGTGRETVRTGTAGQYVMLLEMY